MYKRIRWLFLFVFALCAVCKNAYSQQDVDFHLSSHLFAGKKILKVKRDYYDAYLWVLAQNNEVYRVNSQTLAIDDYTATFAAYNNLQFVDIAGRSQDTAYIATNSSNLITLKKGTLKVIGTGEGISGSIRQIGMNSRFASDYYTPSETFPGKKLLMVATTADIYYYDIQGDKVLPFNSGAGNNMLFETTYRSKAYSYLQSQAYPSNDGTLAIGAAWQTAFTLFVGYFWYNNPVYGNNIYTGYYINSDYNDSDPNSGYNDDYYLNEFWGTENGLMQATFDRSIFMSSTNKHYLDGIKVNKITSIYGLISFPNMLRENLLIGTDKGLYFSNSAYQKYILGPLNDYNTFTLDSEIGNKAINDICVDATSYLPTICEGAAWVAADDGLYLIKPDYNNYLGVSQIKAIAFQNQPDSLSTLNMCSGDSTAAVININVYNGKNIQWYKDGVELPAQSKDTLIIKTAGDYSAVLYDPCEYSHLESNHLKVNVISSPVFTFNYPDKVQYCTNNSLDTLDVTYSPSYHYRWYTNGSLNGDTTSSLIISQSGKYYVEVSACTNSWIPSKQIEVDMVNLPQASITSDKAIYCQSDTALLSANTPTDTSYTINWYKDDVLLSTDKNLPLIKATAAGNYMAIITSTITSCNKSSAIFHLSFTSAPTFTFNYADAISYCAGSSQTLTVQGDPSYQYRWYTNGVLNGITTNTLTVSQTGKYKVEVSACQNSWVPSKEIQANFLQLPLPVIKSDKPAYCIGDQASLNLNIPTDSSYTINWLRDGTMVYAYQGLAAITTSIPGSYTAMITSTSVGNCNQTTSPVQITFSPPPQVSIQQIVNTTLCSGQDITLKASYSNGTAKWSTGESSDQINVKASGKYAVSVTTDAGCVIDTSITINFLPNPVLAVHDTDMCEFSRQNVTLTAPAGYSKYVWNGQEGNNTFVVNAIQTVSLTVTDANGCEATQKIIVSSNCAGVQLPNAFTPNGDGINDTWTITGLTNDPSVLIQVYNRYGTEVYKSKGYTAAWNGTYNGNKLPAGVYYYIISAKNGKQTLSGSVTIIY